MTRAKIRPGRGRAGTFGLIVALIAMLAPALAQAACRTDTAELRGDWGRAQFTVELADTPETRSRGLMHRESLARGAGMLFIYDEPTRARFWMRNTLIPLDMIFIDRTGVVTGVHHEAVPHDETTIDGGDGVLMVLEINGGLAEMLGIAAGSELRHPRLPQNDAVWPCAEQ